MKKTVNIMDYRDRLFAADLFAGIVLEEDLDPGWRTVLGAKLSACNR